MKRYFYMLTFTCLFLMSACTNLLDMDSAVAEIATKTGQLETVEVTLEEAGTLAAKIGDKKDVVEKLIVAGPFDANDVTALYTLPALQSLDMKNVTIVGGNKTYATEMGMARTLKEKTIGVQMFYGCYKLSEVILPANIVEIGDHAFVDRNIMHIDIPETVTTIGPNAFARCHALKEISFPSGLKTWGEGCCSECYELEKVLLPTDLDIIPKEAFRSCKKLADIQIPETVTKIGRFAFYECEALTRIELPGQLQSMDGGAFMLSGLTDITIPESVNRIGEYECGAFQDCLGLTAISIPDRVESMGQNTFAGCTALASVKLSNKLETIPDGCFAGCTSLTSLTLPESVKTIGPNAFINVPFKNIILPDKLERIDYRAFHHCPELESISIPKSVTVVSSGILSQCYKLTSIFWNTSIAVPDLYYFQDQWGGVTSGGNSNCLLYLSDKKTKVSSKWTNIIIDGVADQITLSSNEGSFHCPQSFKALKISYTYEFSFPTYFQEAAGWVGISLPFTVTHIEHEDGRVLAPFGNSVVDAKPFWLRRLTANGFENTTQIEAGVPYIVAMPHNEKYADEYNITGKVTFSAKDASNGITIPVTPMLRREEGPEFILCSNYEYILPSSSVYILNKDNYNRKAGSVFERSAHAALSFEPYVTIKNLASKTHSMFSVGGSVCTRSIRPIGNKPDIDDL